MKQPIETPGATISVRAQLCLPFPTKPMTSFKEKMCGLLKQLLNNINLSKDYLRIFVTVLLLVLSLKNDAQSNISTKG